jgi:hypothetical protein
MSCLRAGHCAHRPEASLATLIIATKFTAPRDEPVLSAMIQFLTVLLAAISVTALVAPVSSERLLMTVNSCHTMRIHTPDSLENHSRIGTSSRSPARDRHRSGIATFEVSLTPRRIIAAERISVFGGRAAGLPQCKGGSCSRQRTTSGHRALMEHSSS